MRDRDLSKSRLYIQRSLEIFFLVSCAHFFLILLNLPAFRSRGFFLLMQTQLCRCDATKRLFFHVRDVGMPGELCVCSLSKGVLPPILRV